MTSMKLTRSMRHANKSGRAVEDFSMTITNIADQRGPRQPAERGRLEPIHWASLSSLPKREPLIDGLLDIGTMSAIVARRPCSNAPTS